MLNGAVVDIKKLAKVIIALSYVGGDAEKNGSKTRVGGKCSEFVKTVNES